MIRIIVSTLICAGLAAPAVAQAQSALPREGTIEQTLIFHSTFQRVALDKEFTQVVYDAYGSALATNEGGFGDRSTGRCVGTQRYIKGKFDTEIGGCQFVDRSGDTYFTSYTVLGTDMPGHTTTKGSYVGGTGKYAGITGSYETRRQGLPSPGEGRGASLSFAKGTYRLP